jgi:hypothetical protein
MRQVEYELETVHENVLLKFAANVSGRHLVLLSGCFLLGSLARLMGSRHA